MSIYDVKIVYLNECVDRFSIQEDRLYKMFEEEISEYLLFKTTEEGFYMVNLKAVSHIVYSKACELIQ